ncbi:MAG: glutathione synthase [Hominilimicola sp.]
MNLDNEYIFEGSFGLERETLRVTGSGELAHTPHPFHDNKYLDRDFCENQLELITPVCADIDELMDKLITLDTLAKAELKKSGEYLWLCSNPPHFETESDIVVAQFAADKAFKHDYRVNLERRYGKRVMLYSGIHFNFSFSERLLRSLCVGEDYEEYKNRIYFRMSKQVCRYSWLIVLLTAASPVYDLSLDGDYLTGDGFDGLASRRNSIKGYWNQFVPILDYKNINTYIRSIREYVLHGMLFSAGELYLPVRLKPPGSNSLEALEENGIDHIELRMFDINPLSPLGIFREDMEFAHYFLIYLLSLPDFDFTPELQKTAVKNHQAAARYDLSEIRINGYRGSDAALGMLDDMLIYFRGIPKAAENIEWQKTKIRENKRYCVEVYKRFHKNYQKKMLERMKEGM